MSELREFSLDDERDAEQAYFEGVGPRPWYIPMESPSPPLISWLMDHRDIDGTMQIICPRCYSGALRASSTNGPKDGKDDYHALFWLTCQRCNSELQIGISLRNGCCEISEHTSLRKPTLGLCESPAEVRFAKAAIGVGLKLQPQVEVGAYRLDFAETSLKVAVEIDGHDYHKTKQQRTHDAKRDRDLLRLGWQTIRFTGSEVYKDAYECAREVAAFVAERDKGNG